MKKVRITLMYEAQVSDNQDESIVLEAAVEQVMHRLGKQNTGSNSVDLSNQKIFVVRKELL